MKPPEAIRCAACQSPLTSRETNCPQCGASVQSRKPAALTSFAILGYVLLGLILAVVTIYVWTCGLVAVSEALSNTPMWNCAGSILYDLLCIGMCAAALAFGITLAKRGRSALAIVMILVAVLGLVPATLCTSTMLIQACK